MMSGEEVPQVPVIARVGDEHQGDPRDSSVAEARVVFLSCIGIETGVKPTKIEVRLSASVRFVGEWQTPTPDVWKPVNDARFRRVISVGKPKRELNAITGTV